MYKEGLVKMREKNEAKLGQLESIFEQRFNDIHYQNRKDLQTEVDRHNAVIKSMSGDATRNIQDLEAHYRRELEHAQDPGPINDLMQRQADNTKFLQKDF
jgi:hypothetical protein